MLCPWGLLLQINTQPSQSASVQHQMVCALVGLWIKNLEFEILQGHCHVFSGKANYSGSLLLGRRLKEWVKRADRGN